MQITQNNVKQLDPASELQNLAEDLAGYDCAYEHAKDKREAAEKALELAKAEEKFEADKLRAILAAVRTKSATDAKVYDQHLRTCLSKMNTQRDGNWDNKTRRYAKVPIPGVKPWAELARTGATDAQITSNLKIGFDSYSGVKSGLYQLKGMQFKSTLGEDSMGKATGSTILDAKQLVAAIRRVMKIANPKPKDPPPAKKPAKTTAKKLAAPAAKKAPEKKPAAAGDRADQLAAVASDIGTVQKHGRKPQTWRQWCSTIKALSHGDVNLFEGEPGSHVHQPTAREQFFLDAYNDGNRPIEAMDAWKKKQGAPDKEELLSPPPPKKSKVKKSPEPPAPAKLTNVRVIDHDRSPAQKHAKKMLAKAAAAIDKEKDPSPAPLSPHKDEHHRLRTSILQQKTGRQNLEAFLREHKGEPEDEDILDFLAELWGIRPPLLPYLFVNGTTYRGTPLASVFRETFLKNWPLSDPPAPPGDWMTYVEEVRRLSLGQLELHEGPVRPELWKFFQDEYNAGAKPVQAVERWHVREMDEAKKKTQPAPADSKAHIPAQETNSLSMTWNAFMDRVHELNGNHTIIQLGNTACWNFFINEWQRNMTPHLALNAWNAQHGKSESAPTTSLSNGSLRMPLFDSPKPPDQLEQKLSWEQWAHQVRTCKAAKTCGDWPQSGSLMNRQPLVDADDRMVRAAYEAGRKPAAAAAELAQMFTKRASRADRSRSTLSDAEEKSLRGQKVGAA